MEDELDAALFVLAVQLGITVVVADQRAAADTVDPPDTEMAARAVVSQITGSFTGIPGAEPLVVSLDDLTRVADDIQAVMRLRGVQLGGVTPRCCGEDGCPGTTCWVWNDSAPVNCIPRTKVITTGHEVSRDRLWPTGRCPVGIVLRGGSCGPEGYEPSSVKRRPQPVQKAAPCFRGRPQLSQTSITRPPPPQQPRPWRRADATDGVNYHLARYLGLAVCHY